MNLIYRPLLVDNNKIQRIKEIINKIKYKKNV